MSKLGNIYLSYGKELKLSVANTYSNIILSGSNLPVNSIIISSNVDEVNNDTGTYSLIATDNDGNPVRLTYCIKPGNGLGLSDTDADVLELKIDNKSIKNSSSGLTIDLSFINSKNINKDNNILSVDIDRFPTASDKVKGIVSIDGKTILTDEDTIFVNTDELQYSDNSTGIYGIISDTDGILTIDNGIVSINEDKLPHAEPDKYGTVISDNNTVNIEEGIISINTERLRGANYDEYGIIGVDGVKIKSEGGLLYVDTNNLEHATSTDLGTISIDGDTVKLNNKGQIMVSGYGDMMSGLNDVNNKLSLEKYQFEEIKNAILSMIN